MTDRSRIRKFYLDIMYRKKIGDRNPIQTAINSGDCKLTKDGEETRADLKQIYKKSYYFKFEPDYPD